MSDPVRILLVDDHTLFRQGLRRLLESDPALHIVSDCKSVREAISLLDTEAIDLVLLDYDLQGERGDALLTHIRDHHHAGVRVLLVTAGIPVPETLRLLNSGAGGIFLKHSPPEHLTAAIQSVMEGRQWLDPQSLRAITELAASGTSHPPENTRPLTLREREVLKGVFEGFTNKEIGARLDVSESSVKAVIQQLFMKTGVRTRSQLVRIALEKHADWLES